MVWQQKRVGNRKLLESQEYRYTELWTEGIRQSLDIRTTVACWISHSTKTLMVWSGAENACQSDGKSGTACKIWRKRSTKKKKKTTGKTMQNRCRITRLALTIMKVLDWRRTSKNGGHSLKPCGCKWVSLWSDDCNYTHWRMEMALWSLLWTIRV